MVTSPYEQEILETDKWKHKNKTQWCIVPIKFGRNCSSDSKEENVKKFTRIPKTTTTKTTGNSQMMIKKAIAKLIVQRDSTVPLGCRTGPLIRRSIELQPKSYIFMTRQLYLNTRQIMYACKKSMSTYMPECDNTRISSPRWQESPGAWCHHLPFRHRGWHTFVSPRGKYSNMSPRHKSLSYRIQMQHRLRWPKIRKSESWFAKLMLHVFIQCCHAKYWFCDPL